ncbi:hypothetical protein LCGC14_0629630 [marine sediment metagenome]|uniref:2-phospho-L-lactate transferase n=1 Tax=marine sediment metagenome TaxID=412755 RepID=A0A0F9R296_9ZZZZ
MTEDYYVLLAGGVGAAKFIEGIAKIVKPELLKIIINTGDDIELFGLRICPDLDIITYSLANLVDQEKGWGFTGETFNCLSILKKFYDTGWFNAGDKDLATHIYRTDLFRKGYNKTEITEKICDHYGVKAHLIPMCNEPVETYIKTAFGMIHFEEFFIKYHCEPEILDVVLKGIDKANPADGVINFIENARRIIICPSNPIVSIGTILQVKGIRSALSKFKKKVFGISPIVGGVPIKGPADKLMRCLGLEVSSVGVAKFYQDILSHFIIDNIDNTLKSKVEELGITTYCCDTIMTNIEKKVELAKFIINLN